MNLRRALPKDAEAIRNLVRQAYSKWIPLIGREPKPMNADYDHAVRTHLVWVMCNLELSQIRLYNNQRFAENLTLYSKLGYRETHRQDFPQFGGAHNVAVFMSKLLRATQ